jgi:hypothetical protein
MLDQGSDDESLPPSAVTLAGRGSGAVRRGLVGSVACPHGIRRRDGFTVDLPNGKRASSLCEVVTDQTHPWYGHGSALRQRFPVSVTSDAEGRYLALELNARALSEAPMGFGFGSFGYQDGALVFQAFFPNPAYRLGLVANLYLSCAERARMLSVLLTGVDWTEASFDPGRSAACG